MQDVNMKDIIAKYGENEKDSGSSSVQIALLTAKIKYLTEHLRYHKKDQSSRRGLLRMVSKRRRLLSYLRRESRDKYDTVVKDLAIRH